MGMKKALTRIFSRKSQDGVPVDTPSSGPTPGEAPVQNGVVALASTYGGLKAPAVPPPAPLSGLAKLAVVLSPPQPDPQKALVGSGAKGRGASRDALAATKIQAAYRGYLVRRSVRTHKSVVKVQALVRGHIVRRQAAITLRCMNALVRVQARARAHAVRNSATGREVQQRLEAVGYRQQQTDGPGKKRADGWVGSSAPIHDLQANYHRRQTGFIKRERARAYAASFQKWKTEPAPKTVTYIPNDPDHEGWGWGWLERWMVARPWRNRSFIDAADLSRKEWAPPRRVVSDNGHAGAHLYRRLSTGSYPAKVVEREEPNLSRDVGEARQCKWCGRHSTRVKDTEAGPLCGVCQLNTSTAARLNKDPYAQTGTKVAKQVQETPSPAAPPAAAAAKAVEWEAPKVTRDVGGDVRQCKWCGRMSNRVKDTQGGPLCGVCQLNTATATRLNRDPYTALSPKGDEAMADDSSSPSSVAKTRSVPSPLSMPPKAATPSPTAPRAERRQSFPSSLKVTAGSPLGGSPASTPKSVMSPLGTPRFMQPTASSRPKLRTTTTPTAIAAAAAAAASPRPLRSTPTATAASASASASSAAKGQQAVGPTSDAAPLSPLPSSTTTTDGKPTGHHNETSAPAEPPLSAADVDAARASLGSGLLAAVRHDDGANGAVHAVSEGRREEGEAGEEPTGGGKKGSEDHNGLDLEPTEGAGKAGMHSKSPLQGWPSTNGAPVITQ